MKKGSLFLMICLISLGSTAIIPRARAVGAEGEASLTYSLCDYSDYTQITHVYDGATKMGSVQIYDDGSNIYLKVLVWSKPWLACGEKPLDKNSDGILGPGESDKNGDGNIDKFDLKSDGLEVKVIHNSNVLADYLWYVDTNKHGVYTRDPHIQVPSWTDGPNDGADPWGILTGPIVYLATIPVSEFGLTECGTEFDIEILELHASPPMEQHFWIPEFPLGTISTIMVALTALGIFLRTRSKIIHV